MSWEAGARPGVLPLKRSERAGVSAPHTGPSSGSPAPHPRPVQDGHFCFCKKGLLVY